MIKYFFFLLMIFSCGSSQETEISEFVDQPVNIDTKKNLQDDVIFISQIIDGSLVQREVLIEAPDFVDVTKNYPVVIAFHGRNTLNDTWINKLNRYTSRGDFIGVYPQGYLKTWNSGGNEPSTANDIEFIDSVIVELGKYKNLDMERIYGIGTSNGSSMINKLAIETSYFKAVSPIVSQLSRSNLPNQNTNPVAVLQINGSADTTIPINGGPKLGYVFLDALESATTWAEAFSCDNFIINKIGDDDIYIFKNCDDSKEVHYLRIEDGEHNLHWGNPNLFDIVWGFLMRF